MNFELYNKDSNFCQLSNIFTIEKSNIFIYGMLDGKPQNLIYKLKYAFISFDKYKQIESELKDSDSFHTYYTDIINDIKPKSKSEKVKSKAKENKGSKHKTDKEFFTILTCRHIDYSFKIYLFKKSFKKGIIYKKFSYVCEDFVTSCCTVSGNQFILGLKNGKLIYCSYELISKDIENNNKNKKDDILILMKLK